MMIDKGNEEPLMMEDIVSSMPVIFRVSNKLTTQQNEYIYIV